MSICLLFVVTGVVAASNDLIERARQLQLADNPAWLDLIHLHTGLMGVVSSEVDDPGFFLADSSSRDAQVELDSTLRGFNEDVSLACQFPARWYWLSQYLNLGPQPECTELVRWKQKLGAQHLTLLFPSMYLQNPASMFGHTFLRLDQTNTSPLLAYTLSYAAKPDKQDNVISFIYKGVFGGYPGVFALQPYYQTVTDYGDIEHRDIREYALNLNAREIDHLLNHVWELRDKNINYYFLRENCARQLLALIDVARPGLNLARQQFSIYAIPVDTVRSLSDAKIIESSVYRPARASRVAHMYAQLDARLQVQAVGYLNGDTAVPDQAIENDADQARVLELASDMLQIKNQKTEDLLAQRSQIPQSANWLPFISDDPKDSHDSARWSVAYGDYEQRSYAEFGLRPALHDLLDDDAGLMEGAGLEVLSARVRYYPDEDRTQLQQLTIFGMQSYTPIRPWNMPLSSELIFAMNRMNDNTVYVAEAGLGLSAKTEMLHGFALANLALEAMPEREQSEAAYMGAHIGVRSNVLGGRIVVEAKWQNSFSGYDETRTLFKTGYQWDVSRRYALRVEYVLWRTDFLRAGDVQLGLLGYF